MTLPMSAGPDLRLGVMARLRELEPKNAHGLLRHSAVTPIPRTVQIADYECNAIRVLARHTMRILASYEREGCWHSGRVDECHFDARLSASKDEVDLEKHGNAVPCALGDLAGGTPPLSQVDAQRQYR
jgi:hypothetical protein